MPVTPPSPTIVPRSLAPKEHGAYGQLGVPLVASLALSAPNLASIGLAVGAVATFLAHEPLLILLGQRGTKARSQDGPRAAKRLRLLGLFAVVGGLGGLVSAPTIARFGALPPLLLGSVVVWFVWRKEEKTTLGEIIAATALSGVGFPVALAQGVDIFRAGIIWLVWTIAFTIATFSVRAVIARAKHADRSLTYAAYVVTILSTAISVALSSFDKVPTAFPIALLPFEILGFVVLVAPVHTKHLRRVGWGLVAASVLTGVFVVAMLR